MKINTALISVYDKTGIIEFAKSLSELGIKIISTGGTYNLLKQNNIDVVSVSDITRFPEILNGRVKTLHPDIFGGILADKNISQHLDELKQNNINPIDLVVVNLYPFAETVAKEGVTEKEIIEEIDIGGVTLIRAAAKNFNSVNVIVKVEQYENYLLVLKNTNNNISEEYSKKLASEAFANVAGYDFQISNYFQKNLSENTFPTFAGLSTGLKNHSPLRYGENPHQKAFVMKENFDEIFTVKGGKELSYNNMLDMDAAYGIINEFKDGAPTCAIIKHGNPCGVATADTLAEAYQKAFSTDTDSPFGGILVFNDIIDFKTSKEVNTLFFEILLAPGFEKDAYDLLSQKKNRRLIEFKFVPGNFELRKIAGGYLYQDKDNVNFNSEELKIVTTLKPDEKVLEDMNFANKIVKHVKSNAIVFVKDKKTLGIGGGQPSRIESTKIAINKAEHYKNDLNGSVAASDAFFPFPDGVEMIAKTGAKAIIQPGGSVKDKEVIEAADKANLIMAFSGIRHFKH
jgi:phosphoribosylaminoimidazolecarboxamide formyltransferase/IMP cyclohydrolase